MNQVKAQIEGGQLLGAVKAQLVTMAKPGVSFADIDTKATALLMETGGQPSFSMVPGYHWSTCININDGIVHGIPHPDLHIKSGDLVTIDVGLYHRGFHTDTSTSLIVGKPHGEAAHFLEVGRQTLVKAIAVAIPGNKVWDISHVIQTEIEAAGYNVVRDLTGHGVGKQLHMDPAITCYTTGSRDSSPTLSQGQAIAIEVMYTMGDYHLVKSPDDWTLSTRDHSLSAVFEETIIVSSPHPQVVTLAPWENNIFLIKSLE